MTALNFLYVLGELGASSWQNNEIRYSLRALEFAFPVDWIGIAGPEMPEFLSGITHIKVDINPDLHKHQNVQRQLLVACERRETPENLILMNDDFIVRPLPVWDWTPTHRSVIKPFNPKKPGNNWFRTVTATGEWLRDLGIPHPLSYEGHTPMPFKKSLALPVLRSLIASGKILQFRSAYGNLVGIGGRYHPNAKRKNPEPWPADSPFWSLKSRPSDKVKDYLEHWFVAPSRWEVNNG